MTYRGQGQSERTAAGSATYQEDVTGVSEITTGSSTTYVTRDPDTGEVVDGRSSQCTCRYLLDGLGSVVAVVDGTGTVRNRYSYDPYGNVTSATEGVSNPFRYLGQIWDSSTSLYNLGERYYDASIGAFTQVDPGGSGDSSGASDQVSNLYAYADGNPTNEADPIPGDRSPAIPGACIRLPP